MTVLGVCTPKRVHEMRVSGDHLGDIADSSRRNDHLNAHFRERPSAARPVSTRSPDELPVARTRSRATAALGG